LQALVGKQVIMEVQTDPSLIGGVVARIGDTVYDGSVKTQLAQLKEILAKR
jgi:F-type H+-transporting ATPase subunit delta